MAEQKKKKRRNPTGRVFVVIIQKDALMSFFECIDPDRCDPGDI